MSHLLYSTANTTRAQLAAIPTPPALGRFHQPYPFGLYVDEVTDALDRIGYQVLAEEYEVTPNHSSFFGALEIAPVDEAIEGEYIPREGYSLLVGVRGSHDQRLPRGLVLGSKVFVCSNLAFSGNIGSFASRQTKYLHTRLPRLINEVVAKIPHLAEVQDRKFEAFKEYAPANKRWGDAALVEILRQGGLSPSQLGRAVKEWDRPSHDEHASHGYSAWRLFNAVTEALKPTGEQVNHNTIAQRTEIVDRFLTNITGVAA